MKRTFRKFRGRKPFRTKLARRRRTWIESVVIDPCAPLDVPFCTPTDGCCTTLWKIVLVDNQVLQSEFSDRASVVRILGDLWINVDPQLQLATDLFDVYDRLAAVNAELFFGLKKGQVTSQDTTNTADIWDTNSTDLSEYQWMKTWAHRWESFDGFQISVGGNSNPMTFDLNIPISRPDVHTYVVPGTPACSVLATGSGNICIETTDNEDCFACPQSLPAFTYAPQINNITARPNWHVHFDVKKRIPMRENEELFLMFNGRSAGGATANQDFTWEVKGNLRSLVEVG